MSVCVYVCVVLCGVFMLSLFWMGFLIHNIKQAVRIFGVSK